MGRTKRKTPDRWEQYLPMGKVIEGTRFVAFKTPLKPALSTQIDKKDHFNVSHVILEVARLGCRLGMVVDLTNTDRYYDSDDLTKLGVEYFKLNCPGHEVDGREDIVVKFIQRIDDFLSRHTDEDLLIGVHCTHGINRTGYLISRYLIDRCDWSADAAMGAFEAGRGYAIERGNYVSALNRAEAQRKSGRRRKTWEVQSDSSDEPKRKKKKKKAKKRSKNDTSTVPDANEMQQMWQMMVGAAQTMLTGAVASPVYGVPAEQQPGTSGSSKLEHEDGSAADDAAGQEEELEGEEDEGDDDYDDGEQEYPVILGEEEAGSSAAGGASKRRRERRKRLQDMFHKMQKGRFWEIREMQKERYGF